MNTKIVLINLILIGFVLIECWGISKIWLSEEPDIKPDKKHVSKPVKFKKVFVSKPKHPPISAYNDIPNSNLFSIERKEYVAELIADKEPGKKVKNKVVIQELNTDKITLYGVIILENLRQALVTDVDNQSERSTVWVEKGDSVDGFTIDSIEKDRIIVTKAGRRNAVLLYDKQKPKKRTNTPVKKSKDKKVKTPVLKKSVQTGKPAQKTVSPKEDEEYEIIQTPFGEFKRKKRF